MKTSDKGSQYRCGRWHPTSSPTPIPPPTTPATHSHTPTYTVASYSRFQLERDGLTDGTRDGPTDQRLSISFLFWVPKSKVKIEQTCTCFKGDASCCRVNKSKANCPVTQQENNRPTTEDFNTYLLSFLTVTSIFCVARYLNWMKLQGHSSKLIESIKLLFPKFSSDRSGSFSFHFLKALC